MANWSVIPNLLATALILCALISVLRRSKIPSLNPWLGGWVYIFLHFAGLLLYPLPGFSGRLANAVADISLLFAALTFQRAAISYRKTFSGRLMLFLMAGTGALYMLLFEFGGAEQPYLDLSALLLALAPLANFFAFPDLRHQLPRKYTVSSNLVLGLLLIALHHQHTIPFDFGPLLLLCFAYVGTALHFWYNYRQASVGSIITILSFFVWGAIFPLSYWYLHAQLNFRIESEIWNIPKYLVAVGMILLLLEDEIQHSRHLALHDDLTGLPNRRLFQDRLDMAIARAQRSRGELALLLIDLDHFKYVNDNYGHHTGDEVLRRVASAFLSRLRRSDTLARTGGDEFSLILEDPDPSTSAEMIAESLHQILKDPIRFKGNTLAISASIGIAYYPQDASSLDGLCVVADNRMYQAKREHRFDASIEAEQNLPT